MYENHFKTIRVGKGLKQKQLADALGVTGIAIQNYENNRRKPAYDILIAMADYFGVSLDYLVGRTNNPAVNR